MADLTEVLANIEKHLATLQYAKDERTQSALVSWLRARAARHPTAEAKALLRAASDIELGEDP